MAAQFGSGNAAPLRCNPLVWRITRSDQMAGRYFGLGIGLRSSLATFSQFVMAFWTSRRASSAVSPKAERKRESGTSATQQPSSALKNRLMCVFGHHDPSNSRLSSSTSSRNCLIW